MYTELKTSVTKSATSIIIPNKINNIRIEVGSAIVDDIVIDIAEVIVIFIGVT